MAAVCKQVVTHQFSGGTPRLLAMSVAVVLELCVLSMDLKAQSVEVFQGRDVAAAEVLVKFRQVDPQILANVAAAHGIGNARAIGGNGWHRLHSTRKNVQQLLQDLGRDPNVLQIEPNYIIRLNAAPPVDVASTTDPMFSSLWGLENVGQFVPGWGNGTPRADIEVTRAWGLTTGDRSIVTAVVDTGIDCSHPDLAANCWSAPRPFTVVINGVSITCPAGSHGFNAINNTCDPADDHSHGTHVSGTIGGVGNNSLGVVGVNWTASIMGLKFLDANGSGFYSDAISAIDFAIQAKSVLGPDANIRVLNNSWGGLGFSQALFDEIVRAAGANMLFVAAAGNYTMNNDLTPFYPASYQSWNIMSVAATTNLDELAYFSDYGKQSVHLAAPGAGVLSTVPGAGYAYYSGTSMATPHVSGTAALVLSICQLNALDLKNILLNNTEYKASLADRTITGGRLNAFRAVSACPDPKPGAPSDLKATSPQPGRVDLTWKDNSTNELRFDIAQDDSLSVVRIVPANTTNASFTGLDPGRSYHWYVRACNAASYCSSWIGPVGKTPDGSDGPPVAPSDLKALSPQVGRVDLTWKDNSSNELRFEIAQDDSLAVVRTVAPNITAASFSGLSPGVSYHWYVRACNTFGCSSWLGPVGKTPDGSDGTNDDFANRYRLTGAVVTTTGSNVGSTAEPGEPVDLQDDAGKAPSVWWTWTAPCSFAVTQPASFMDTIGSNFDTVLGVFTGSTLTSLRLFAVDDDSGGGVTSRIPSVFPGPSTLRIVAGTAYQIRVRGYGAADVGSITLHIKTPCGSSATNDNFANRLPLTGAVVTTTGSNVGATAEAGEPVDLPDDGGNAPSVWWTWTAPCSFAVTQPTSFMDTIGSNFDTVLGVFTGSTLTTLRLFAVDDESGGGVTSRVPSLSPGPPRLNIVAGTAYQIRVRGYGGSDVGSIVLHINSPCGLTGTVTSTPELPVALGPSKRPQR